eukprot:1340155-Rhodomonas_salina.1
MGGTGLAYGQYWARVWTVLGSRMGGTERAYGGQIVRFLGYCPSPPSMVLEYYSLGCLDKVLSSSFFRFFFLGTRCCARSGCVRGTNVLCVVPMCCAWYSCVRSYHYQVMYEKRLRLTVAQNTSVALDVALGMAYLHHQVRVVEGKG